MFGDQVALSEQTLFGSFGTYLGYHSREGELEVIVGRLQKLNMNYQTASNNSLNVQLKTSDSIHAKDVHTNLMKSSWELWGQKRTRRQFPKQSFHIQHTGGAEFSQQSFQDGIVHKRSQIFYNSVLKVEFKLPSLHQILQWGKWKWNKNQKSTFGRRTSGHCKQLLDAAFWFSYWIWNLPEIDESGENKLYKILPPDFVITFIWISFE